MRRKQPTQITETLVCACGNEATITAGSRRFIGQAITAVGWAIRVNNASYIPNGIAATCPTCRSAARDQIS